MPTTPTVTASTPDSNTSVVVAVTVGQPRAGGFQSIQWSGGGKSGTHTCGCAPGTTVRFTISNMGIDPLTVKVRTVNTGGRQSAEATSNQVTPYGPTLAPNNLAASVSGRTITWTWNLRTNGRAISDVQIRTNGGSWRAPTGRERHVQEFAYSTTVRLEVRARTSATTWAVAGPRQATTVAEPKNPTIYSVRSNGTGIGEGSCSTGCPKMDFDIRDFPGNTSWTITCFHESARPEGFTSSSKVNVAAGGNGYSWGGYCVFDKALEGRARIRLVNGGTVHYSPWVTW